MKQAFCYAVGISILFAVHLSCSKHQSKDSASVINELQSVYSQGTPEYSALASLAGSGRYTQVQNFISAYGDFDLSNASVAFYNSDSAKPWISIPVTSHGTVVGFLRVAKVSQSKQQSLGRDYVATFVYYTNGYTGSNQNGDVEIYDLDDSNQLVGKYSFQNGSPTADLLYSGSRVHYCDKNQNGNVTFGECMTCMVGACFTSAECGAQCVVYQVINGTCLVAFNTACQIISIIY